MRLRLRPLFASLLVSFVAAAAASAGADPFSGTWTSIDLDGSNQKVTFTSSGYAWQVDYYDDRATACAGSPARASGSATASGNTLAGSFTAVCESGATLGTFPLKFTFDPGTGMLTDSVGVVWTRVVAPSLTVTGVSVRVAWKESRASGSVTVSGSVTTSSQLVLVLRSPNGKTIAQGAVDVRFGGDFTGALKLPPGLVPGTYALQVSGLSGGTDLPPANREVVVPSPPEGVVRLASASTRRGGPPVLSVSGGVKELWARFQFAARPKASSVTVYWITPSGQIVGSAAKPYTQTVDTFVGSAASLQKGTWQAVLKAKGKVVKRVTVKVK